MDAAEKISLSGSVGVAQVAELHASTQTIITGGNGVHFDFTEARDIDASILQLMLATRKAAVESGVQMQLTEVSDSTAEAITGHGASCLLKPEVQSVEESTDQEGGERIMTSGKRLSNFIRGIWHRLKPTNKGLATEVSARLPVLQLLKSQILDAVNKGNNATDQLSSSFGDMAGRARDVVNMATQSRSNDSQGELQKYATLSLNS